MKKQTGIWVDSQVWKDYRDLCSKEKVRPAEPIEEYIKLILHNGSALAVLNMMRSMEKSKFEGLEAYARVLLNWYINEKQWISISDESDAPIEPMLLHVLKDIRDAQLRQQIEEALKIESPKKAHHKRKAANPADKETKPRNVDIRTEDSEKSEESFELRRYAEKD